MWTVELNGKTYNDERDFKTILLAFREYYLNLINKEDERFFRNRD